jgi:hypothetical protein
MMLQSLDRVTDARAPKMPSPVKPPVLAPVLYTATDCDADESHGCNSETDAKYPTRHRWISALFLD